MALSIDFEYLRTLIDDGTVGGSVLEVGSRSYQGASGNAREVCEARGIPWQGADIQEGPGVDFLLDILAQDEVDAVKERWDAVLLFNLLEHVYEPAVALRNALKLVNPGGVCVVAGPIVMNLHDFPADYWRPLPDFYIECARRCGVEIVDKSFVYQVRNRLIPVAEFSDGRQKRLPTYSGPGARHVWGTLQVPWSRFVHRVANTYGRETPFPVSGLAVAFRVPREQGSGFSLRG